MTEKADIFATPEPPEAPRRKQVLTQHGHERVDHWHWLRDDSRSDPEVIALLEAENEYTEAMLAPAAGLRAQLQAEMTARVVRDDSSVPVRRGDWYYATRFQGGDDYPVYERRFQSPEADAQVVLDCNQRAEGQAFYRVGALRVSDDQRLLAFTEDVTGDGVYTVRFSDMESGRLLDDELPQAAGQVVWSADGRHVFFVRKHPDTLLPYQLWRHRLGSSPDDDVLCHEESDPAFAMSVYRGLTGDYIYLHLGSTLSDEIWLLAANQAEQPWRCFHPREPGLEYSVTDSGGRFFIRSNWQAENFCLAQCSPDATAQRDQWRVLVPSSDSVLLEDFEVFSDALVINERSEGLLRLRVLDLEGKQQFVVDSAQPAFTATLGHNVDAHAGFVRYNYSSLTTPPQVWDLDLKSGEKILRKQTRIPGGYDPEQYVSQRLNIKVRDDTQVPVSLVYRRDGPPLAERPLVIYGYGAYGISIDPEFGQTRISLLDRKVIYAIAHIRGGEDLGRRWYKQGRMADKINTFNDFIDVTRALPDRGMGDPQQVYAIGGSAGGLLMGAVANMAPELYRAMVAQVPFVDVVTTMLDEDIPLTTGEFDEWGNPAKEEHYHTMLAYSPYDQVSAQDYPHLLVTSGFHDAQVQYWEPVKWVAKLRQMTTGDNLLLLHMDMDSGHSGASGRYRQFENRALEYGFLLHLMGQRAESGPNAID